MRWAILKLLAIGIVASCAGLIVSANGVPVERTTVLDSTSCGVSSIGLFAKLDAAIDASFAGARGCLLRAGRSFTDIGQRLFRLVGDLFRQDRNVWDGRRVPSKGARTGQSTFLPLSQFTGGRSYVFHNSTAVGAENGR